MTYRLVMLFLPAFVLAPNVASAYVITFDEAHTGTYWATYYGAEYGAFFDSTWQPADHSASWAPPYSGTMVLANVLWNGRPPTAAMVKFGLPAGYPWVPFRARGNYSVGAYFSTESGVVIQLWGLGHDGRVVASSVIGSDTEPWSNHYAELASSAGEIMSITATPVSSPDALLHWCLDDLTIIPVPEPSSLASLSLALLAAGAGVRWRRRG